MFKFYLIFLICCVPISNCSTIDSLYNNRCSTCPYQNSPCGYNSPCGGGGGGGGGYSPPTCSQGTCYQNHCQYLPCYYNAYKNYPYGNSATTNQQNIYNYPFMPFTNDGKQFSNNLNNDPFANAELEIIDHNSTPPSIPTKQQQQQYPNYYQLFNNNMMNVKQDPFANVPVEIIDEDQLEANGIDPKMLTSSHSSYSVKGGQQSIVTQQKTIPISTTFTRTFTPQKNVEYSANFVDGKKISDETTTAQTATQNHSEQTTTTTTTTTEENDEPQPVNQWFK